jgi:hypothetical protein
MGLSIGADLLSGGGGTDQVFGGAEGDYCAGESTSGCEFGAGDEVSVGSSAGAVTFELGPGSTGSFDAGEAVAGGCNAPSGFAETTSPILLGGEGADALDGGEGTDNANWANFGSAVALDLGAGLGGLVGPDGEPGRLAIRVYAVDAAGTTTAPPPWSGSAFAAAKAQLATYASI